MPLHGGAQGGKALQTDASLVLAALTKNIRRLQSASFGTRTLVPVLRSQARYIAFLFPIPLVLHL
jgi:hypothetical protein